MFVLPKELEELKSRKQWVLYRRELDEKGKLRKVPYNAMTGKRASPSDPETWCKYEAARMAFELGGYDGLGITFAGDLMGIDIDHCRDPKTGELLPFAQDIIDICDTYTEISPSGTGVHCLCYGAKPADKCKVKYGESLIEMYDSGRYFTVTGNVLMNKPINVRSKRFGLVYKKYFETDQDDQKESATFDIQLPDLTSNMTDLELITKAFNASNGTKFKKLWDGDISDYADDHSSADQALIDMLAYWTNGDAARMDSLFRQSGLMRHKWDEKRGQRGTYGEITIQTCLAGFTPYIPATKTEIILDSPGTTQATVKTEIDTTKDSVLEYIKSGIFTADKERFKTHKDKKTGFAQLDQKADGIYSGLYVIGGISSVGKTTFAQQLADQIAYNSHSLYFSLEQSRLEMVCKSIARGTAKIDPSRAFTSLQIRNGVSDPIIEQATGEYLQNVYDRITIIEGNMSCTVSYIKEYVTRYIEQHDIRPAVFIDYLQIMQPEIDPETKRKPTDPRLIADYNVTELKRMTRDLDIPVFVISSVNRSNYLTEIDFESFKESGGIEYTADVVWGLQLEAIHDPVFTKAQAINEKRERIREAKTEMPRKIELVCLKNRYGASNYNVHFKYWSKNDLFEAVNEYKPEIRNTNTTVIL